MTATNILKWKPTNYKNEGDAREWAVCGSKGIERVKHDAGAYDTSSDVNCGSTHISVKASKFSLMSGSLCEGLENFDAIWNLYESKCHSNTWVYVTADYIAYEMNMNEFEQFVYEFCKLERESEKNGGAMKIRCKAESKKMLKWLAERAK